MEGGAVALESELSALQYLKRQRRWRVVEDDHVETIGGHVSGKCCDHAAQPPAGVVTGRIAVDENCYVDVAVGARPPGRLRPEEKSGLNLGQRLGSTGDGALEGFGVPFFHNAALCRRGGADNKYRLIGSIRLHNAEGRALAALGLVVSKERSGISSPPPHPRRTSHGPSGPAHT